MSDGTCWRCGAEGGDLSMVTLFDSAEPSKRELVEVIEGKGFLICGGCQDAYLDFMAGGDEAPDTSLLVFPST